VPVSAQARIRAPWGSSAEHAPLGRCSTRGHVAVAVVFFLSDAARHIAGQTQMVDAGFTLPG
jgi:enoyl-[acyl-carrier-protein] reductase (NADH)